VNCTLKLHKINIVSADNKSIQQ